MRFRRHERRVTCRSCGSLRENARLKKLVAERDLVIEVMKEVAAKNVFTTRRSTVLSSCQDDELLRLGCFACIESPDRQFPSRQRLPFVPVQRGKPSSDLRNDCNELIRLRKF